MNEGMASDEDLDKDFQKWLNQQRKKSILKGTHEKHLEADVRTTGRGDTRGGTARPSGGGTPRPSGGEGTSGTSGASGGGRGGY